MRRHLPRYLEGQSLVIIMLFLALIFIVIGLAIDGGLLYAQRRLMQNTADAACLAASNKLALGQSPDSAITAASEVISTNLSLNAPGTLDYTDVSQVYSPTIGSGVGLSRGIEVLTPSVRVALRAPAFTYFLRMVGIETYTVSARARCAPALGGGASPFAVSRWRGYDSRDDFVAGLSTDLPLPQTYREGGSTQYMRVRDILQAQSLSDGICCPNSSGDLSSEWPGWFSGSYPGNPLDDNFCCLYSQPLRPATPDDPGYETVIVAESETSNDSGSRYKGTVVLDFRDLTRTPFYANGLTPDTDVNVYKDFVTRYILDGYPGPFIYSGQQVAVYSGLSAGQVVAPFDLRYDVGDEITVLIYNGTIYENPSFRISFPPADGSDSDYAYEEKDRAAFSGPNQFPPDCDINAINPVTGGPYTGAYAFDGTSLGVGTSPAAYRLTVDPLLPGGNQVGGVILAKLRVFLSSNPPTWGTLQGRWTWTNDDGTPGNSGWLNLDINGAAPAVTVDGSDGVGTSFTLQLQQSETGECITIDPLSPTLTLTRTLPLRYQGAQSLYIEVEDSPSYVRRAIYALVNLGADSNDFYAYFPGMLIYDPIEPGDPKVVVPFKAETVGGTPLNVTDLDRITYDWFEFNPGTSALTSVAPPADINAQLTPRNDLEIRVGRNAAVNKRYYLRITVQENGYTHWVWYHLWIREPLNQTNNINEFIYVLGYARMRVTYIDSNTIKGRAISGLLQRPDEILVGFLPRLVSWEE
ncbi:MAG: hypothetical protein KatS3mg057_0668 [Herpetosiphonaceae bacterium]|nr:MAG: hypothetical protein KatS3mg057_0668 [Herpetosiphonaceae bacterium]